MSDWGGIERLERFERLERVEPILFNLPPALPRPQPWRRHHAGGSSQTAVHIPFREQAGPHRCADENTDLPRRGNVTHGGELHGRKDENIRQWSQRGDSNGFSAVISPLNTSILPVSQRKRCKQYSAPEICSPVQQQRRDRKPTHGLLIPQRVGRDEGSGDQSKAYRLLRAGLAELVGIAA